MKNFDDYVLRVLVPAAEAALKEDHFDPDERSSLIQAVEDLKVYQTVS